jgi:hypothetical protein
LTEVRSVPQGLPGSREDKPSGLWFSIEEDWKKVCEGTGLRLLRLAVATEIVPAKDSRLLSLAGERMVVDFTTEYAVRPDRTSGLPTSVDRGGNACNGIDWRRVASQYQGIVISPFVCSLCVEPRTRWYSWWDCESGCLWDSAAVAALKPLNAGLMQPLDRTTLIRRVEYLRVEIDNLTAQLYEPMSDIDHALTDALLKEASEELAILENWE